MCLSIVIYFLPDSPVWLRSKKRFKEADSSAQWLKLHEKTIHVPVPATTNVTTVESVQEKMANAKALEMANDSPMSKKVLFTRPVLLPLSIGLVLLIIQQVSGIDAIIFFTVEIFRASGIYSVDTNIELKTSCLRTPLYAGSSINEHLATIIVGLVQLISNIASLFVVDRAGRKPLLIGSGILMCISTAAMGTAFYLNEHGIREYGCVLYIQSNLTTNNGRFYYEARASKDTILLTTFSSIFDKQKK